MSLLMASSGWSRCSSQLLHEAMHRLQHCRQPELAVQLNAAHHVEALEEEARELQRWSEQKPLAAADWLRLQLRAHCSGDPSE